jgi:hypothetical protein
MSLSWHAANAGQSDCEKVYLRMTLHPRLSPFIFVAMLAAHVPRAFYDTGLNPNVRYGRHAISIHQMRASFQRVRWALRPQRNRRGKGSQFGWSKFSFLEIILISAAGGLSRSPLLPPSQCRVFALVFRAAPLPGAGRELRAACAGLLLGNTEPKAASVCLPLCRFVLLTLAAMRCSSAS